MEIERKWIINSFENIPSTYYSNCEIHLITQGIFIYNEKLEGRVREDKLLGNNEEQAEYCIIMKDANISMEREEFHSMIGKDYADWLFSKCTKKLQKVRMKKRLPNGLVLELNKFCKGYNDNSQQILWMVEIEFSSQEEADKFQPLEWFGEEVTTNEEYFNKKLTEKYGYDVE